jgi:type I restriction enzyme S subunit
LPILAITQDYGAIPRDLIDFKITVTDKSVESYKVVEVGDFIISLRSFQGGIEYSEYKGICSPAYIILRPIISIDRIFFKYYLKTPKYITHLNRKLEGIRDGKMISYSYFSDIILPLPSIEEQNKVSAFLSIIESRIATQKKIIEQLKTLMKASREKIFSQKLRFKNENDDFYSEWKSTKLKNISQIFDGTHQTPKYVKKGIPFYSVENVTANNFSVTKYISEEVFIKENNRVKIEKGDILMTRIGDIGTVKYIDWNVNASFYVSLALIKSNNDNNSKYLAQYISSDKFQNELWNRTIHVAFPKKINLGEIGECLLKIPCIEEQTKIANFLSSIQEKIETEKQILEKVELQKKFLLANLFV